MTPSGLASLAAADTLPAPAPSVRERLLEELGALASKWRPINSLRSVTVDELEEVITALQALEADHTVEIKAFPIVGYAVRLTPESPP